MFTGFRPRASHALVVAVVAFAGCSSFTPTNDHSFAPPAEYRKWFDETQACSGLKGSFDRIKWYTIEGTDFDCPSGRCVGRWNDDHSIFVASAWVDNELVVRHEMLHDLIGHPGHPDPPFGSPCPLTWATWHSDDSTVAATPTVSGRVAALGHPNID
jgi:hypothetical protein